jgi:hypothetical protein
MLVGWVIYMKATSAENSAIRPIAGNGDVRGIVNAALAVSNFLADCVKNPV